MSVPKDFIITKVGWHTQTRGNLDTPEEVKARFRILVDFLQRERLVVRELLKQGATPTDDFAIQVSDLTELGFAVMKSGYDKWLRKVVDKRKDVADLSILEAG